MLFEEAMMLEVANDRCYAVECAKFMGVDNPDQLIDHVNWCLSRKGMPIIKKLAAISVALEGGFVENEKGGWDFHLPKTKDCITRDAIRRARKVLKRKGSMKFKIRDLDFIYYQEEAV